MKPFRFHVRQAWPALLFTLWLAGCETVPPAPVPAPVSTAAAEQAERRGEHAVAAREYERLADRAKAPQRQQLQLRAVDAWIKAGRAAEARQKLAGVRVAGLEASFGARKRVLEAKLLVLEGNAERALRELDELARAVALDPGLRADIALTRARAELAVGNPFGAVRDLVRREQYLAANEAVADNQLQLWRILSSQSRGRLATELDLARDPVVAGWIELALAVADAGAPERIAGAVAQWKAAHAGHPAGEALLTTLTAAAPASTTARARSLALLLPLTSNIALAAQAVRDGFVAMDGANANAEKPRVKIYDIGADPAQAPAFYTQAVREGAQVVVGPLGREAAERIAREARIEVPTLLLSVTDEAGRGRPLFQFGLPPEQEARAVAERAWLDGHRRAAVLYPKDTGERMHAAFADRWQRLGGTVVAAQAYQENQSDHSDAIKRLLNIHLSEARRAEVEQRVGRKLGFEPRARQDIDFIFLAADAKRARLLKPQLNFWHASRVPVYATSLVYTGRPDPVRDVDLDGIVFADMPWILPAGEGPMQELRRALQRDWPYAYSDLDRLYALGMDSYAVLPHLHQLGAGVRFRGVTSVLALDPEGRLQRSLAWARFVKGAPQPLETSLPDAGLFRLILPGG